jgi:hypothetical protein
MLLAFACGTEEPEPEGLCDPGTNVFCRCPGGEAGTRQCLDSGEDFDECVVAPETPCGERVECEPESTVFCLCPNGDEGLKECRRDGTGYAECELPDGSACPVVGGQGGGSSTGGGDPGTGGSGGGVVGMCAHDICESGDPLTTGCDACVTTVCAADSYCCETFWDQECITGAQFGNGVAQLCQDACGPPPPPMCEHSLCEFGGPLTDSCDPCVTEVCAADSLCCSNETTGWDKFCVHAVTSGDHPSCEGQCCPHSECDNGPLSTPFSATCSPCAAAVCAQDDYCCNNDWDTTCVNLAKEQDDCFCL